MAKLNEIKVTEK